ncbi:hypothetical protein B0F90DRAFT_1702637 [Multifurca ochricompacta]|uniref:Uncharacterized protein n=1 Tax=Multifurca ochricompacta TaxID=376703 RepID=A0AAD4M9S7_9AGAM|nr:hypothetical protein B0F90DRAFT_1702637 [Multifurca ochricompacta]
MADHVELASHLSPVGLPDRKSLKRSASVASLPTPPRTVRKRSRSRGSAYHSSDDEADDALPVVSPHVSPSQSQHVPEEHDVSTHKRRRIDAVVAELNAEDREDTFWLSGAPVEAKPSRVLSPVSKGKLPSSRRGAPTSARRLSQSRAVPASSLPSTWSLLSPPPTRPRPPVTPPRKRLAKPMPVRDSPNNPFLVEPSDSPASVPSSPVGPRTPVPDKETIHYVFRGKRLAFQNPHFGVPRNSRSMLQPEHPDFSPSEDCTPRRLFGPSRTARSKEKVQVSASASASTSVVPKRSLSPAWEVDDDDDDALIVPPRASLAQEFERVGKAEGRKVLSSAKEEKVRAETLEEHKDSIRATTSGSKRDETSS